MKYIIRPAAAGDAPALCRLNREEMGYDYPLEDTARRLLHLIASPTDALLVAESDEGILGYVHAQHYELLYAPPMKNIMGIAVSSAHRRKGIGKALLERVEQLAREDGCSMVRLVSGASRTQAHEFYRTLGYGGGRAQLNFKKSVDGTDTQN